MTDTMRLDTLLDEQRQFPPTEAFRTELMTLTRARTKASP